MSRDQRIFENIQMIFGIYLIPIVCLPGLLSNILCLIVFVSNSMRRFVTTQFLFYLAISDTIKLSNDLLYSIVLIIQTINHRLGSRIFLLLYRYCHYINTFSTLCTAWLTLVVAIERSVSSSAGGKTCDLLRLDIFRAARVSTLVWRFRRIRVGFVIC